MISATERLANIAGHETFGYGQGSYDGDACRHCAWEGLPGSGKRHTEETRQEAFERALMAHDSEVREDAIRTLLNIGLNNVANDVKSLLHDRAWPGDMTPEDIAVAVILDRIER